MYSINRKEEFYRLSSVIENLMNHVEIMKNDIKNINNCSYKNTFKIPGNKTYECLENINMEFEKNLENLKELLEPFCVVCNRVRKLWKYRT